MPMRKVLGVRRAVGGWWRCVGWVVGRGGESLGPCPSGPGGKHIQQRRDRGKWRRGREGEVRAGDWGRGEGERDGRRGEEGSHRG